jgi:hypothetical protein
MPSIAGLSQGPFHGNFVQTRFRCTHNSLDSYLRITYKTLLFFTFSPNHYSHPIMASANPLALIHPRAPLLAGLWTILHPASNARTQAVPITPIRPSITIPSSYAPSVAPISSTLGHFIFEISLPDDTTNLLLGSGSAPTIAGQGPDGLCSYTTKIGDLKAIFWGYATYHITLEAQGEVIPDFVISKHPPRTVSYPSTIPGFVHIPIENAAMSVGNTVYWFLFASWARRRTPCQLDYLIICDQEKIPAHYTIKGRAMV